jgi:hypothetical protein
MEHHELIAKAKSHVGKIQPRDTAPLSAADFPRIKVRETAMVCFESDERNDKVWIFLDETTGDFVTLMYHGGAAQLRNES